MKKYVFVLVLMFGFIFCLQGQPKNNPGKRITDYVSVDVDGKVDSIHYTYSTQFDSLPSVINRKYADYGVPYGPYSIRLGYSFSLLEVGY